MDTPTEKDPSLSHALSSSSRALAIEVWSLALLVVSLTGFIWIAVTFPGTVDVRRYPSGIFDADVDRVVRNTTSVHSDGYRLVVHPLYHVLVTPLSRALEYWPLGEFQRARLVCIFGILLQAALVWAIARLACPKLPAAGYVAAAVFLSSFSAALFSVIPESCAWSGISALLSTWFFLARRHRSFSVWEALAWAVLFPLSIGYTVSQFVFWPLAFLLRLLFIWRDNSGAAFLRAVGLGFVSLTIGVVSTVLLANLQHSLNHSAPIFYAVDVVKGEGAWARPVALQSLSPGHVISVLRQVLSYPFVPPVPGYSGVVRSYGHFSLSLEDANLEAESWLVSVLRFSLIAVFFLALLFARKAGASVIILVAGTASQIILHLFYGRDYILYSLNWLGLLVATFIVVASRLTPFGYRVCLVAASFLLPCAILWNYSVLAHIMSELSYGLEISMRDEHGLRLPSR